ncbi:MAG: YlbF family regulator [Lachnospira sp.]
MHKIEELKLQLCDAIRNTVEYKEYKRLEAIINKDPDLRRHVDEFRLQNFAIQTDENVVDLFDATNELNQRYADLRKQETVNRYLSAEICLCRLVQDICKTVVDAIDFDVDFIK